MLDPDVTLSMFYGCFFFGVFFVCVSIRSALISTTTGLHTERVIVLLDKQNVATDMSAKTKERSSEELQIL